MRQRPGRPAQCRRAAARQPQPAHARQLRRHGVRHAAISTASPASGPCVSPRTSPARCRACRRATTSCAARSTSSGGRGAPSRSGRSPSPQQLRRAGVTTMLVSDHPHLFEIGGRELPHRLQRLGLRARARGRPVAHVPRPELRRRAGAARPAAAGGSGATGWAGRRRATVPTTARARSSAPRRTSRGRGRCAPRPTGCATARPDDAPFLLFVDEFDPHEPFDTPEPWAGRYDPDWEGELLIWPPYDVGRGGRRAA